MPFRIRKHLDRRDFAEVLPMRLLCEVSQVQMRILAMRTVDTFHRSAVFERSHELERGWRRDVDSRYILGPEQVLLIAVEDGDRIEISINVLLLPFLLSKVNVDAGWLLRDRGGRECGRHRAPNPHRSELRWTG